MKSKMKNGKSMTIKKDRKLLSAEFFQKKMINQRFSLDSSRLIMKMIKCCFHKLKKVTCVFQKLNLLNKKC